MERARPRSFCSAKTYVEHHNRELYDMLHDICSLGFLTGRRPLTFLMPKAGSPFHKKLMKMVYGSDMESPMAAMKLIKNCALAAHTPTLSDFSAGEMKTILGNRVAVEIDDTGAEPKVRVGGAAIGADKDFHRLYQKSQFTVYTINSGEVSVMNNLDKVVGGAPASISGLTDPQKLTSHVYKSLCRYVEESKSAEVPGKAFTISKFPAQCLEMAVSWQRFMAAQNNNMAFSINPLATIFCMLEASKSSPELYRDWLQVDETDPTITYTWADWKSLHGAAANRANVFPVDSYNKITANVGDAKKLADSVRAVYADKKIFANQAHDELTFLAHMFLQATVAKNTAAMEEIYRIVSNCTINGFKTRLFIHMPLGDNLGLHCRRWEYVKSALFSCSGPNPTEPRTDVETLIGGVIGSDPGPIYYDSLAAKLFG